MGAPGRSLKLKVPCTFVQAVLESAPDVATVRGMAKPAWSKERSTLGPFFSLGGDRTCHPDEGAVRDQWSRNRRRYSASSDGAR